MELSGCHVKALRQIVKGLITSLVLPLAVVVLLPLVPLLMLMMITTTTMMMMTVIRIPVWLMGVDELVVRRPRIWLMRVMTGNDAAAWFVVWLLEMGMDALPKAVLMPRGCC